MNKCDFFDFLEMTLKNNFDNEEIDDFFYQENYANYVIPPLASDKEIEAIKIIFNHHLDIKERIDKALEIDALCIEAFYLRFILLNNSDDIYRLFINYYDMINDFNLLSAYQKDNLKLILDFFIEHLIDIRNITRAIKVQKELIHLSDNDGLRNITRLCFLYFLAEEDEEFYDFYQQREDFDPASYLLLIGCLLKNDQYDKAKIILNDMISYIPYSNHIHQMWQLDNNDDKDAMIFKAAYDSCKDELKLIPNFFSWCKDNMEENMQS